MRTGSLSYKGEGITAVDRHRPIERKSSMKWFTLRMLTAALLVTVGATATAVAAAQDNAPTRPAKVAAKKFRKLSGGLKYAVLKPGKGAVAAHGDVEVHYTGWLKNGKKFDSSRDRNRPFRFDLGHGEVIEGWDRGVKGMKVGEKRQLVVPPALGYGAHGTPDGTIPPNATLIFEVELIKVHPGHGH
jgi:FKBP-type peptidyl-prolyl cis-trans isomerase